MSERSERISRLLFSSSSRASYIRAKLNVLIPSQIRALRLRRDDMTQKKLAELAGMAQPRISAMERPGATKFNVETLVRLASAFRVGLKVEFVPLSEMLDWENEFSQDTFNPTPLERDAEFINPPQRYVASQAMAVAFSLGDLVSNELTEFSYVAANPPWGERLSMGIPQPRIQTRGGTQMMPFVNVPQPTAGRSSEITVH